MFHDSTWKKKKFTTNLPGGGTSPNSVKPDILVPPDNYKIKIK